MHDLLNLYLAVDTHLCSLVPVVARHRPRQLRGDREWAGGGRGERGARDRGCRRDADEVSKI
jgi:hypothetical protein